MGLYEHDDPSLYRLNVLEIPWDKLQDVPVNESKGNPKTFETDGNPAAINQGTVQVRCFIHPYCPFLAVPKEEYDLTFNNLTVPVINDILPDEAKSALSTTFGVEGMHFTERYVYRHNYVFHENVIDFKGTTELVPVAKPDYDSVNNTRYQEEFSWIIRPSVFDEHLQNKVNLGSSSPYFEQRCNDTVSWQYVYPPITSAYTGLDELNDYKKEFYDNNSKNALTFGNLGALVGLSTGNPGIDTSRVQVPRQASATDCTGAGSHWRIEKKTTLYRGEDFFIDFKRYAKATNISAAGDSASQISFDASLSQYAPIDTFGDKGVSLTSHTLPVPDGLDRPPQKVYVNRAVRQDDKVENRTAWRLFDQAYYIIEIGDESSSTQGYMEHYFIIITERAYPIFVAIDEVDGFLYSQTLSTYDEGVGGVHGKAIINADSFRITVRNHLGKLVINFDLDGKRQTPWIISRTNYNVIDDLIADLNSDGANIPTQSPITIPIVVPNSKLIIWGGNLSCGFSFGPLQYSRSELNFRWPQKHALPMNSAISARLTVSDEYIHDMARFSEIPGSPSNVVPMFTQGAHFYRQWGTSSQFSDLDSWKFGSFFFGQGYDPLIELCEATVASTTAGGSPTVIPGARDVTVELDVSSGADLDVDRRRVGFYLNVFLESGSHVFRGTGGGTVPGWRERVTYVQPTAGSNVDDEYWVIEACKTPILTGVRLVGEQNNNPRWPDGTGPGGYTGLPNPDAPNFRDVSHHVMSYTENWTANDFYELEHSGTIQFLLKPIVVDVDNTGATYTFDDSQYLKSLQNKSFYIEIWAGYEPLKDGLEYTQLGGFYKLMTGMCHGGQMEKTAAREIMTCQVKDYKEVLKAQKFFNSPFFDGVRDVNAIFEILTMAGFRSLGQYDPAGYLRMLKSDNFSGPIYYQTGDGRFFISNPYALPSSYRRIEQAYFKFAAGSTLYDGIMKIAQTSSKLFYFDQHGMAHFESYFDLIQQNLLGQNFLEGLFTFTSNPYGPDSSLTVGGPYQGQLIYNKVEWQHRQEDVHNHIKIISSTPNQELLVADDVRWEAVDQPQVEGFIGYKKLFYQREGMLGSEGAVRNLIDFYRVMFRPELYVKFETHGLPMRATDFITVDGQFLRVSKVSHNINAEKNLWWMNVEGERMQPIQ